MLALHASTLRACYPGTQPVDISMDKSAYLNVDIIYMDGWAAGLGPYSKLRRTGTIVLEFNYKEGQAADYQLGNNIIDALSNAISDTDVMYPVRTFAGRPVSPTTGAQQGWKRESLVTPFWYDTSRS